MRSPHDLGFVRRLNAPTRAAAAKRRRLRKCLAAACAALAVLIALGPSRKAPQDSKAPEISTAMKDPRMAGRHLVSLPADPTLVTALTKNSTVDVWDERGTRLVAAAPALLPRGTEGGALGGTNADPHVLVAVRPPDLRHLSASQSAHLDDARKFTVTMRPS